MSVIARGITRSAEATERLAAAVAAVAQPGDVIGLSGPLGVGKSTFARGFVQALTTPDEDVPSPTFTLVQTYDTARGPLWHCDLYRLDRPEDAAELGLEEAFAEAICLIEWPERLGPGLPAGRLMVTLAANGDDRAITLDGGADWTVRLAGLSLFAERP